MKIVLVFPPFYLESMYNLPPLRLINLATMLEGSGREMKILAFVLAIRQRALKMGKSIYEECADRVMQENPDLGVFRFNVPHILQHSTLLRRYGSG